MQGANARETCRERVQHSQRGPEPLGRDKELSEAIVSTEWKAFLVPS